MNLLIIGNKIDDLACEIWKANTNYTIINNSPDVWSDSFTKFIRNKKVIICSSVNQFTNKEINDTLSVIIKHKFIPIIVADNKKVIENNVYTALSNEFVNVVKYVKNKKNKNYDELIQICKDYILGKGILPDDKIISTSKRGKKETLN